MGTIKEENNCLMHQSIDHHHPPPTRTLWRVLDSQAIEQFVYFDIVATVLRQSWLRGKLPLFNQLVVATVWGSRGWGHSSELQTKSQVSAVLGGGGGCGYVVVVIGPLAKVSFKYVVFSVIQLYYAQ